MVQLAAPTSVYQIIERQLGYPVAWLEATVTTAGTTAARLFRQNPRRLAMIVVNLSANVVVIRPRTIPTTSIGLRISTGGFRSFIYQEDYTLPTEEWFIIADVDASVIYALEAVLRG